MASEVDTHTHILWRNESDFKKPGARRPVTTCLWISVVFIIYAFTARNILYILRDNGQIFQLVLELPIIVKL